MNKYQEEVRITIIYPDGTEKELVGAEKEEYWRQFEERYSNHPMSSGFIINIPTIPATGLHYEAVDRVIQERLKADYAKCDYCGIFQARNVPFTGNCKNCGAPLPNSLTFT